MSKSIAAAMLMAVLGGVTTRAQAPVPPQAQPIVLTPPGAPKWQAAGMVGWLTANKTPVAVAWDGWYDSAAAGGSLGYFWTPHLITEAAFTATNAGRVFVQEPSASIGTPLRTGERVYRTRAVDLAVAYQFLENRWFHPFVDAGLSLGREVERVHLVPFRTSGPGGVSGPPAPAVDERHVAYSARPFGSVGFKWYLGERAFVRSSLRGRVGSRGVADVTWISGVGIDF